MGTGPFLSPVMRLAKLTVKEYADPKQHHRIYTVEAVEVEKQTPAAMWVDAAVQADGLHREFNPLRRGSA